jgi:hypothetical protein
VKTPVEYELLLGIPLLRRVLEATDREDQVLRFVSAPADRRLVVEGRSVIGGEWHEVFRSEAGKAQTAKPTEQVQLGGTYL